MTMERIRELVTATIRDGREDLIALLQAMIRTPSVNPALDPGSAGEGAMAGLVEEYYRKLGIPVQRIEAVPGRPNLIATWKGSGGSPKLLVNCHLDTVAADVTAWVDPVGGQTLREWTTDPFGGELRDGRIYGRGAADHKSPIAAMLFALKALKEHDARLTGDVTIIHDADEETGGRHGMKHLSECLPFDYDMALYACSSEFTPLGRKFFSAMGADNIIRSFSGWQTYQIRIEGQNLHNLTPKRGYGAAEAALALLDGLKPLINQVNAYIDPLEGSGQPAMRISGIECAPRRALHHQAPWCDLVINRRIPPSVDRERAAAELQNVIDEHNAAFPDNRARLTVTQDLPPMETPEHHPVVQGLSRAVRSVVGREPVIAGLPAPVGISTLLARHPMPTVLFGYGSLNMHHAIDEYIESDALGKMASVYAVALMEWLGVAE